MKIGSKIKHIKRGTEYEVIGVSATVIVFDDEDVAIPDYRFFIPNDNAAAMFVVVLSKFDGMAWYGIASANFEPDDRDDVVVMRLPLLLQLSGDDYSGEWTIYRQLDGAMVFARPTVEFTPDRFEFL